MFMNSQNIYGDDKMGIFLGIVLVVLVVFNILVSIYTFKEREHLSNSDKIERIIFIFMIPFWGAWSVFKDIKYKEFLKREEEYRKKIEEYKNSPKEKRQPRRYLGGGRRSSSSSSSGSSDPYSISYYDSCDYGGGGE